MPEHRLPAAPQPIPMPLRSGCAVPAAQSRRRAVRRLVAPVAALLLLPPAPLLLPAVDAHPLTGAVLHGRT